MQSQGWGLKNTQCRPLFSSNPQCRPLFFKHFLQFKEKHWLRLFVDFALKLYNSNNYLYVPGVNFGRARKPGQTWNLLDIDWSWIISLCKISAQCSSSSSFTSKKRLEDSRRTENLKFKTDLWDWVMDGRNHSRWLFTKAACKTNGQIKNQRLSCQCRSLHGFQT